MRITYDRAMRVMQQVHEDAQAKRSLAGRMFKSTEVKQGQIHGWGKASESLHRARGATSPLGGQAKK